METLLYIFIFIFDLIIGSFLNCVIYRLEEGRKNLKGRSFCPNCHHSLGFFDLIPVLSFVFLKGKCQYCKKKISWQYPMVEIATAAVFLLVFNFAGFNLINLVYLLVIASLLIVIFVFDLKHYIIPDSVIFPAIAIAFVYQILSASILIPLLSGICASAFFLTLCLASKGAWLGFGDVKLVLFMGLFLSFPQILIALFFSFMIGAIMGVGMIALKKKSLKSEIPFGPFLIIGLLIAFIWGNQIASWYINLIL